MSLRGQPKRFFTAAEDDAIRAGYRRGNVGQLASDLARSVHSVQRRARHLGVKIRRGAPRVATPALAVRAAALVDAGHGLKDIAARLGHAEPSVREALARIGRKADGRKADGYRESAAARLSERNERNGPMVLARWRALSDPYGLPPLSAEALQVLFALLKGPLTKQELCAATGRPWLGPKKSLRTHGGMTFTDNLKGLGLIACTCTGMGKGAGRKGARVYRYWLTPKAMDALASAGKAGA